MLKGRFTDICGDRCRQSQKQMNSTVMHVTTENQMVSESHLPMQSRLQRGCSPWMYSKVTKTGVRVTRQYRVGRAQSPSAHNHPSGEDNRASSSQCFLVADPEENREKW